MSDGRKKGPYGCKCQTLAHKLVGDGCDECQPMSNAPESVTADEAREAWRSIVDDAEILNETPRHKDTSIILAYIDQSEAEVARLREALEEIARRDPVRISGASVGTGPVPESPLGDIARRALNRETTDE